MPVSLFADLRAFFFLLSLAMSVALVSSLGAAQNLAGFQVRDLGVAVSEPSSLECS